MDFRTLELTLISAQNLKEVNLMSKMDVYAVVSITNDPQSQQRTLPDRNGGRNPTWNCMFRFTVPATDPGPNLALHVLLCTERALGDRDVGNVTIPLRELLPLANNNSHVDSVQFRSYDVHKPQSRETKGVLSISYKLGPPVLAYPYPTAAAAGYGYYPPQAMNPPPPGGYYPPQTVYPQPPAAAGYGYQPQVVQPERPKRNKFKMGFLEGASWG